ncbi:hypothetical protein UFOVP330_17 [uncultured Caudovirales phage]|uniref:Uncharacterized protein n=1 Tax=uncultured Caudovirales phage TaxID=2100421 RepID=A0A6J5LZ64_9CAUD|nr:hypothetical protein UFOVP330_17 [uncultured Caudovirales phage]
MSDDDLIRRGDVASVVRQTLVDAAHRNAGKSGNWPSAFFKAEDYASVAIAAMPAQGVAAETERCLGIVANRKGNGWEGAPAVHPYDRGYIAACDDIAAAIREGRNE